MLPAILTPVSDRAFSMTYGMLNGKKCHWELSTHCTFETQWPRLLLFANLFCLHQGKGAVTTLLLTIAVLIFATYCDWYTGIQIMIIGANCLKC